LADCCRIFENDIVLVKCLMSLVRCDKNDRSVHAQFDGQVRRDSAGRERNVLGTKAALIIVVLGCHVGKSLYVSGSSAREAAADAL